MTVRKSPQVSEELHYLRLVTTQEWADDNKNDVALSRYRTLMNNDPKWCLTQKRAAEKEYRDEMVIWKKEKKAEVKKVEKKLNSTDPCDVLVTRLLDGWDKLLAET